MRRISSIIILLLAVAVAAPRAIEAQPAAPSAEDIEKAKQAYLEGQRLIDDEGNVAAGVEKFKESYRLSRNPVLLYNIAFALDGLKQRNMALFYYRKFLVDAPEGAPNRDVAAERIKVLEAMPEPADPSLDPFAATDEPTIGAGEPPAPLPEKPIAKAPPKPPPVARTVTAFEHKVIEEAPPQMPLDLTVAIPDDARWQVKLFYRGAGNSDFVSAGLTRRYSELIGRIPASAVSGTSIQYYIEARDSSGKVVARSGRAISPNLVFVDPAAKPRFYDDLEDDGASTLGSGPVAGGAAGGGATGGGGPSDLPRDTLTYLKWGTTAGSTTFLTMAVTFYFISSSAASTLEGEAFNSTNEGCQMGPPCRTFSDTQRDLQSRGETFETMTNVTMVLGLAAGAAAGYFWYKDLQRAKKKKDTDKAPVRNRPPVEDFAAVPMLGPDFIGGAAAVRF
ncbi:MAG TPA: hypothetical protein VML75_16085 [Kofleriaceae bacterium]|nr:hypothetical protein [Kofleriaceae bacterium]